MGEVQRMRSRDLEEIEGTWREYVPSARLIGVDRARHSFDWTSVRSGGLSSVSYTLHAGADTAIDPHTQLFACHVTGTARVHSDGHRIDPSAPWLAPDGVTATRWVGAASVRAFVFDRDEAERTARVMSGDDRLRLRVTSPSPLSPSSGRAWLMAFDYTHRALADASRHGDALLEAELRRHALRVTLASFATTLLDASHTGRQRGAATASVRRAKAYIDEHASEAITLDDVAAAAHLSTRGLQYAFRRVTGDTPMAYLRRVRLSGADAELRTTDDPIAVVARRWGFGNPSRFARYYREAYGRSPSELPREADAVGS